MWQLPVTTSSDNFQWQLPVTVWQLPVTVWQLPVTVWQLPVTVWQLPVKTSSYCLTTSSYCMTTSSYCLTTSSYCLTTSSYCMTTSSYCMTTSSYCMTTTYPQKSDWQLPTLCFSTNFQPPKVADNLPFPIYLLHVFGWGISRWGKPILFNLREQSCVSRKVSKSESVRIRKCQNQKVSEWDWST